MDNMRMKRPATSLIVREMHIKTTMWFHFPPVRVADVKAMQVLARMWPDWNPCALLGVHNGAAVLEKSMEIPQKNQKENHHMIQQFHVWVCV